MRQKRLRHPGHAEEVHVKMLFDESRVGQVIILCDSRIVDQEIELPDLRGCALDVVDAGNVEREMRNARIAMLDHGPHASIDALGSPWKRLVEKRLANTPVGTGDQDGFVRNVHALVTLPEPENHR
jgi:hypothetical protein